MRLPILGLVAILLLQAVPGATQDGAAPMRMLENVRDRRYCEFFIVKRQAAHLVADIYNTLNLNDCPQAAWDGVDDAKLAAQFGALRVIRNGPRHFIMDRLASADVADAVVDMQGLAMRHVATMKPRGSRRRSARP